MEITVTELEPCKLEVFYSADSLKVNEKEKEVLEVFKKAPVSGYRSGKAPLNIVKLKYKNQIHESLKRAMIEEAYSESVFEKNLNVLSQPEIKNATLFGDVFTCTFGVLVRPEFELKPFNYELVAPHYTKSADDVVAAKLEELRRSFGDVAQYSDSDTVQIGDNVIINYSAKMNGEDVEALKAEGDLLTVGSSSLIGFDENIVGMSVNETKSFSYVFGDSAAPAFAGKEVNFELTLVGGSRVTPCPLDDSLAVKLGKETYNELHLQVSSIANSTIEVEKKQMIVDTLTKKMLADYDFPIPDWMGVPDARMEAQRMNMDYDTSTEQTKQLLLDKAKSVVKLSLVLDKIRTEEPEAQLSEKEIYESVKGVLSHYGNIPEEKLDDEMKKLLSTGEFRMIAARLLDEHTINFLLTKVTIVQ